MPSRPDPEIRQVYCGDPRPAAELIQLALTEPDEDAAYETVKIMHFRASTEDLAAAQALCTSPDWKERVLGAQILGQLGVPDRAWPEQCFHALAAMLTNETDQCALQAICYAFGHLDDPRAVSLILPLARHSHADVRYAVVHGLSCYHGLDDPVAIHTLIELSRDEDEDIRDWATFGIGTLSELDTTEIREALLARVSDPHDDTRCEALVGLARRKDLRALEPLLEELDRENIGLLALEAAEKLADHRLGPRLLELKESWAANELDGHVRALHAALLACLQAGNA